MDYSGARSELRVVRTGVVPALRSQNGIVGALDTGRSADLGYMRIGIVVKFLRYQAITVPIVHEQHIVPEFRLLGLRRVLSIFRSEGIHIVFKSATGGVPSDFRIEIIVQTVGHEIHRTVPEFHILPGRSVGEDGMSGNAVIEEFVGVDKQRVALPHLDVSVGIKRVFFGIIPCRVAEHPHIAVPEYNRTLHYLKLFILVRRAIQGIGLFEEYPISPRPR